ncbi:gamma-glutamylcyclotransferase family protein [Albidovulum sp.]
MSANRHPAFFGYGSLVNRATHDHRPGEAVTLRGWRRVWRHTRLRDWPYLSVEPAAAEIDGLIAAVPGGDWSRLDAREAAYRRHPLRADQIAAAPAWAGQVELYAVDEAHGLAGGRQPILLSYLDTVVQGFLREFGEAGVARFFATTRGWTWLLDDRAAPLYPRHQPLGRAERRLVDDHLDQRGLARRRQ